MTRREWLRRVGALGVAAAVATDRGGDVGTVPVAEVPQRLRAGGSWLP